MKDDAEPACEVCSIKVRKPEVAGDPEAWFLQLEAQFTARMSDEAKFRAAVSVCPTNYFHTAIHIIRAPPAKKAYSTLKKAIIEKHSESEEARLRKFLDFKSSGEAPSESYRRLVELSGSDSDSKIIRNLWSMSLPRWIRIAVETHHNQPFEYQLEVADSLYNKIGEEEPLGNINSIQSKEKSDDNRIRKLEAMVNKLMSEIDKNPGPSSFRSPKFRNNRFDPRKRSQEKSPIVRPNNKICWYHRKFGNNSHKCILPCSFRM